MFEKLFEEFKKKHDDRSVSETIFKCRNTVTGEVYDTRSFENFKKMMETKDPITF